ncbi:hypothetical protein [Lampropedia hyalina]|nr:hypothetical protein [Lampropedia hyalina]
MKLSGNVLYTARLRGRLSPILAGAIAEKLGEDVQHWITVAVLETEKESGALDHLKKTADRWLNKVNS